MPSRKTQPSIPTAKPIPQRPSDSRTAAAEVELGVAELEERIAPRLASNHNETVLADV